MTYQQARKEAARRQQKFTREYSPHKFKNGKWGVKSKAIKLLMWELR